MLSVTGSTAGGMSEAVASMVSISDMTAWRIRRILSGLAAARWPKVAASSGANESRKACIAGYACRVEQLQVWKMWKKKSGKGILGFAKIFIAEERKKISVIRPRGSRFAARFVARM